MDGLNTRPLQYLTDRPPIKHVYKRKGKKGVFTPDKRVVEVILGPTWQGNSSIYVGVLC